MYNVIRLMYYYKINKVIILRTGSKWTKFNTKNCLYYSKDDIIKIQYEYRKKKSFIL